ncbi:MAG TPA: MinD/ParA family protein [Candidatus Eisenbacteria bacterium]|nr:MinD/ParA family protein [Candidatus Eisenbacteria bacterium]
MSSPIPDTAPPIGAAPSSAPVRVIAVASGKGGVGKTNITANLAVTYAQRGDRVLVLDADLGLANIDVVYGVTPEHTLLHVLRGEHRLADVIALGPAGVRLVPAASGVAELTALTPAQRLAVLDEVDALEDTLDVLLIDVAAGISSNVLYFAATASETLVVVTPEPTAMTDAYALVKVLATRWGRTEFPVVVNMAASARDADEAFARLARVAAQFLPVRLDYVGWVPLDDAVPRAVRTQAPIAISAPGTPAARAIAALADRLRNRDPRGAATGGLQFFFRKLLAEGRA